jgi:putative peptide zinc metalloprotease protein
MAMVWVTDDEPVLNTNEAYAFASCTDCVTVAVAFQVVVIVGSADVVIPQNLSAAVNYECFECITAAIAHQLMVTVESLPGVEEQIALAEIWDEIGEFADAIPTLPLAEVIARLEEYKEQIVSILGVAPAVDPEASPSAPPGEDPDATPSPDASAAATPEPTASPAPAAPDTTPAPTTELTPSPTPTPTPSPAP